MIALIVYKILGRSDKVRQRINWDVELVLCTEMPLIQRISSTDAALLCCDTETSVLHREVSSINTVVCMKL